MTHGWIVKVRHYDGSTSIVSTHSKEWDARLEANRLNTKYQSPRHFAESYDPMKAGLR